MEYDLFRRLAVMYYLLSMSGSFGRGFVELYAAGAGGNWASSLHDKIDSQLNLSEAQGALETL
jgi:hypothetical protein